ncbi:MAG: hypothetical protein RR393_03365 [Bacteroidales bacterium]
MEERIARLQGHKSPDIVDSVQFVKLKFAEYKRIKEAFPNKLFIYVSHIEGKLPDGNNSTKNMEGCECFFSGGGF